MTQKATDPKTIGIEKQLARISDANRAAATRYVAIRRLHGLREGSVYNYASVLRKLDEELDATPYADVTADQILQFLTDLQAEVSTATIVGYIRLLRRFFKDQGDGTLPAGFSPILTTRDPPPPDHANIVGEEELRALLGACRDLNRSTRFPRVEHNQAFILTLWDSGFRISELLSVKMRNLSFDEDEVMIKLDPRHRGLKSGARTVFLKDCTNALKAWCALHPGPEPDRYVFLSNRNADGLKPLGSVAADRLVKKLAQTANVFEGGAKQLSCHDFRHTSATRRAHWGEAKLRLFHGWSRDSRMPSRYVHQHLDDLREAVRRDAGLSDLGIAQKVESGTTADQLVDLLKKLTQ